MSRIGYRRYTACLGLVVLLALSSCGKKADDNAAGGSPSASSAPTASASASSPEAAMSPSSTTASSSPEAAPSSSASTAGSTSSEGVKPNGTDCPASAPIKARTNKKRGKTYYTTKFPDYKKVKPETCFADASAAQSAGFHAPGPRK